MVKMTDKRLRALQEALDNVDEVNLMDGDRFLRIVRIDYDACVIVTEDCTGEEEEFSFGKVDARWLFVIRQFFTDPHDLVEDEHEKIQIDDRDFVIDSRGNVCSISWVLGADKYFIKFTSVLGRPRVLYDPIRLYYVLEFSNEPTTNVLSCNDEPVDSFAFISSTKYGLSSVIESIADHCREYHERQIKT